MKNFENLLLSFPELEESTKQSTKGGYDTYDPETDWWHNFDPDNDVIDLPGVTITPGGGYVNDPYNGWPSDPYGYGPGGGYGDYGGGSGGSGGGQTPGYHPSQLIASGTSPSLYDIVNLMATSLGAAASHTDIAASVLKLESAPIFQTVSRLFGTYDVITNTIEFIKDPNWEDGIQVAVGITLTAFELNPVAAVVGGTALAAWELYEYKRDQ